MKYLYLLLCGILGVIIFLQSETWYLKHDTHKAAKAGALWITTHQSEINDPGVVWILSEINKDYCDDDKSTKELIAKMFQPFRENPTKRAYERLIDPNYSYVVATTSLKNGGGAFDDFLIPALYCDVQQDLIPSTIGAAQDLAGGTRYQITHAYLGLIWMKERHCLTEKQTTYVDQLTPVILYQQSQLKEFDDLYAENVAFLLYAHHEEFVSRDWIQTIIKSQEDSGGWKSPHDKYIFGSDENTHTTALSLFALTQISKQCPF